MWCYEIPSSICNNSSEFTGDFGSSATHLFEAEVGDVPQDALDRVRPLALAERILLRADDIDVVWDVIGRVVSRLALAFTLEPCADVVRRAGIACKAMDNYSNHIVTFSLRTYVQPGYPCSRFLQIQ